MISIINQLSLQITHNLMLVRIHFADVQAIGAVRQVHHDGSQLMLALFFVC